MKHLPMFQRTGNIAFRAGLGNTYKLDGHFKSPHKSFKTIHVGGTNGKGSVSHMLASVLQEAGYKVGLYTSPHLIDFRERIKVNGKMITKKYVADFIKQHKDFFGTFDPSFFEISVFMAFCYFKNCNVDVAVIEVGLGGRLDATNIITPVISVITNIGKDHTEILGETLEKIAFEKAGIIKENVPVIIGESQKETVEVFTGYSQKMKAPLIFADKLFRIDYSLKSIDGYQVFNVKKNDEILYLNLKCELLGNYQRKNSVTILATIDHLRKTKEFLINEKDIFKGIKKVIRNTSLQGRWQILKERPLTICDTAHNADGIKTVMQQVSETPHEVLHMIIGFVADKNVEEILKYMPSKAKYYFVKLSVPRTMDENKLSSLAKAHGLKGKAYGNIKEAYEEVVSNSQKDDLVIVTGSNFLVADFLKIF